MPRSDESRRHTHEILKNVPIFRDFSERHLKAVANMTRTQTFDAGEVICSEGQSGVGLHIIEDGDVEVKVGGQTRRQMGAGAFFGEIALLDGGARSATVTATRPTTTISLAAWDFQGLLEKHPEIATNMLPELCRRLRENEKETLSH